MSKPSKSGALTDLVLEIFRLNGLLIASGDALVAEIGLTSARWQVVGAIALQQGRAPVAHIANAMGLTRQSVQRIADTLTSRGLVASKENPDHKRAPLLIPTEAGRAAHSRLHDSGEAWIARVTEGIEPDVIAAAAEVLRALRVRMEADLAAGRAGRQ